MKSLLNRNDLIRVIALVSMVAFPLIAAAQLAPSKTEPSTSGVVADAVAPVKAAAAGRDSCADEHWPNFSAGCLRGSVDTARPRLVSLAAASPQDAAPPAAAAPNRIAAAEHVQVSAPVQKVKKAKPRIAAPRHERATGMAYAANSEPVLITSPTW